MSNKNKSATDEVRCIHKATGKVSKFRAFLAYDKNWQKATGFKPETVQSEALYKAEKKAEIPTPPVSNPISVDLSDDDHDEIVDIELSESGAAINENPVEQAPARRGRPRTSRA